MARERDEGWNVTRIHKDIDRLGKEMVDFLGRFCGIATVNPPGDRFEECAAFLGEKMESIGLETRTVRTPMQEQLRLVPGSQDYPRPSIIGRCDVGSPRTLLMTGHYDVVPATAGWKTDAFKLTQRGGKVFARGVADMKGSNTAAIFAIQALRESGVTPPWNIELAFTPDEEIGGYAGLGYLANSNSVSADAAILLEGGGGLDIGYAHRGVLWLRITVIGQAGHAKDPKNGINAFEKAVKLVGELKKLEAVYNRRPSRFRTSKAVDRHATLMIGGVCAGGSKINTIPDRFSFTIDRRMLPEEKLAEVKRELMQTIRAAQKRDKQLKVEVEYLLNVDAGYTDEKEMICQVTRQAVREVFGQTPQFRMSGGFNDMHFLNRDRGIPTVGYGVAGGQGMHADNESLPAASLPKAAKVYTEIIRRLPM